MLIAIVPLVACVIGLLMWWVSQNGKVQEAGKWLFICGLLITLYVVANHTIKIG